eukprot:CAMPEP_0181069420 /NCGR_PEP_ID=MMETSP1070-20121207/26936_1 /TAXON_ID=265543 /ORGANISM="Minutocellus polymorphus, Strain NH13" /LENGTH=403 /DNA_ID=CAMNT_0023150223 /DNA_START=988 /DNA_END=2196 /DNA_ORIENTATION=+
MEALDGLLSSGAWRGEIAAGMSKGSTSAVAIEPPYMYMYDDAEIETHHDLTAQAAGVLSHDDETNYEYSSDDDEEDGSGPLSNGREVSGRKQSLIGRMRRPDDGFHRLEQTDDEDMHEDADEDEQEQPQSQAPPTDHYYGNVASPVIRQESDAFDNETRSSIASGSPRHRILGPLSTSFDEDFDEANFDEEMEYGISRYNPTPVRTNGRADGSGGSALGISRKESASSVRERIVAPVLDVVDRVKAARAEARRKRAEHLLEINDDRIRNRTRISVWFSTWCDMRVSDRGVLVAASFVAIFIAIYKLLDEEEEDLRRSLLVVGVPVIVLRFTWRWLLWVTYGRWREKRQKSALQLFDGMNDGAGASGLEIPHGNDDDDYSVASSLMLSVVDNLNNDDDDELSLS